MYQQQKTEENNKVKEKLFLKVMFKRRDVSNLREPEPIL